MSEMSFETAVKSRRSVRGFQNREVPQDILNKVFEIAREKDLVPEFEIKISEPLD